MNQKDTPLMITFGAWRGVVVSELHGHEKQRLANQAARRLQQAAALLASSVQGAPRRIVFTAWREVALAARHEQERLHLEALADGRLCQVYALLVGGQTHALALAALSAWRDCWARGRRGQLEEDRLRQVEGALAAGPRGAHVLLVVVSAWREAALRWRSGRERELLAEAASARARHAAGLLAAARGPAAAAREVLAAWRQAVAFERIRAECGRLVKRADDRLTGAEAALLRGVRAGLLGAAFAPWAACTAECRAAGARRLSDEALAAARAFAHKNGIRATAALSTARLMVPVLGSFAAWRCWTLSSRHARETDRNLRCSSRHVEQAASAWAAGWRAVLLRTATAAWKECCSRERRRQEVEVWARRADRRLECSLALSAAGQKRASLCEALSAWREATLAGLHGQQLDRCLACADLRLGQAEAALRAGQELVSVQAVCSAWREAALRSRRDRELARWIDRAEARLGQTESALAAGQRGELARLVCSAWSEAALRSRQRQEFARRTGERLGQTEEVLRKGQRDTLLLAAHAAWRAAVLLGRRQREDEGRLAHRTESLSRLDSFLQVSCDCALARGVLSAWREVTLECQVDGAKAALADSSRRGQETFARGGQAARRAGLLALARVALVAWSRFARAEAARLAAESASEAMGRLRDWGVEWAGQAVEASDTLCLARSFWHWRVALLEHGLDFQDRQLRLESTVGQREVGLLRALLDVRLVEVTFSTWSARTYRHTVNKMALQGEELSAENSRLAGLQEQRRNRALAVMEGSMSAAFLASAFRDL